MTGSGVPRRHTGAPGRGPTARCRRTALGAAVVAALSVLPAAPAQATHTRLQHACTSTAAPTVTPLRPAWDGVDTTPTVSAVVTPGCATIQQVEVRLRRHGGAPGAGSQDVVARAYSETTRTLRFPSLDPSYTVSFDLREEETLVPLEGDLVQRRYPASYRMTLLWRLTYVLGGVQGTVVSAVQPFQVGCTPQEQVQARIREQDSILDTLGLRGLTTLGDSSEVEALGAALGSSGWGFASHDEASFSGMGVAFVRKDVLSAVPAPSPGPAEAVQRFQPDLLFYAPGPAPADSNPFLTGNQGTFTDHLYDFPLTLVGWGYARTYVPGLRPVATGLPCLPWEDWFVHERGDHLLWPSGAGEFVPRPPAGEEGTQGAFGLAAGQEFILLGHPRLWDVHVWRRDATLGGPQVAILHPTRVIPGYASGTAGFFYPNDINHTEQFAIGPKQGNRPPLPPV